jgi:membrane-bound ClpP family serine protease
MFAILTNRVDAMPHDTARWIMIPLLLVLLLAILLFGVGFSVHLLWIVGAIILVLWLVGFAFRGDRRWYRW